MISFEQKTSPEIVREVAQRVRERRKELGLTQAQLAERAGMTLSSYKRFEQKGLVAFQSLAGIAIALRCESDFDGLFAKRGYKSIDEVVEASRKARRASGAKTSGRVRRGTPAKARREAATTPTTPAAKAAGGQTAERRRDQ